MFDPACRRSVPPESRRTGHVRSHATNLAGGTGSCQEQPCNAEDLFLRNFQGNAERLERSERFERFTNDVLLANFHLPRAGGVQYSAWRETPRGAASWQK